jgi:DNA-binding NarL/FixJ family response regulator
MIVEDDAVTRRSLSLAIESDRSLKLVATFDSVQPALTWLETQAVDILLTDLGLPDGSGIEIILCCARRYPNCAIMVITMSAGAEDVLACIEAGASGYVLKDAGRLDIVRAVLDLRAGGAPMSPAIARTVLARVRDGNRALPAAKEKPEVVVILTKREAAILDLIARGDSYIQVARLLALSVGTVQSHLKHIYGKLSVHSRGEAVFEAHRRGLLQPARFRSKT